MYKMGILLQSRGKMKIKELAEELEVSEKQIRNYRQDLEMGGIFIDSEHGPYGGYTLLTNGDLLGLSLNLDELSTLEMATNHLKYNNYIYSREIVEVLDKIKAVTNMKNNAKGNMSYFIKESSAIIQNEVEKKKIKDINAVVITRNRLKIEYFSLRSGNLSERIVHPYGLYQYKGDMYLAAFCENRNNVMDFKVCRIKKYEILKDKFQIQQGFSWKSYMKNCIGVYKDKEIQIKLKIQYPISYIIAEKIWVDNQKITENIEDRSIVFEAKMRGFTEIKSWVLSMGSSVEVIKPELLKEEIKNEIEKLKNLY